MRNVLLVATLGLVACQPDRTSGTTPFLLEQTEFERTIVSKSLAPNVMLLVDNSSAMGDVNDSSSRAAQAKLVANSVLSSLGSTVRFGLVTFPEPTSVVALPPADDDDAPATLQANAQSVDDAIQALVPNGTTSTLAALQFAGEETALNADDDRSDVIVLITGGVPEGDVQATIDFISSLRTEHSIETLVIAIDPAPGTETIFNDMARAGGAPRNCIVDSSACGSGQTCGADAVCSQAFMGAAAASTEITAAQRSNMVLLNGDPCLIQLGNAPGKPEYLSVVLNGATLEAGLDTYSLEGALVRFTGTACETVHDATVRHPASIQVRAVVKL